MVEGVFLLVTPVSVAALKSDFAVRFQALTGSQPYPWQRKLFALFSTGQIPPDINLPTGSGKTSIMIIWLLALAQQASEQPQGIIVPRRLVWVVNRRVVVDQATEEAEQIRKRIAPDAGSEELESVRRALRSLSVGCDDRELIAISTLRGEREDNRKWSEDPSRPAIIVGTVDMIGSRLLFSGYGDGRYWRAQHAGLIGHDTLIVNDEAHLTPAFASLLSKVQEKQRSSLKPFCTLRLSATHPSSECWPNSLEDDREDERFQRVFEATKRVQIRDAGRQLSTLLELAIKPGPARTLIFVEKPQRVIEIAEKLKKQAGESAAARILTLTGTMRGIERDRLVESAVFKAFASHDLPAESFWLIATSAGEVGINISADRLITELDTLDHLLQRFGRLNRFGETTGTAYVLVSDADKKEKRKVAAMDFLRNLDPSDTDDPDNKESYNISPAALFGRELPMDACSEIPLQAELHDWLIDVWSQTTLGRHPARPQVEPWLHGKQDGVPETYIAWREDVRDLVQDGIGDDEREEALQKYRLLAHEQLREPTTKLLAKLEELAHGQTADTPFLRRKTDGSVDVLRLSRFAEITKDPKTERAQREAIAEIAYSQLVLPAGCGRISDGMFDPRRSPNGETDTENGEKNGDDYDVSGRVWKKDEGEIIGKVINNPDRASYRAMKNEDGAWAVTRLGAAEEETEPLKDMELGTLHTFAAAHGWRFRLKIAPENDAGDGKTALLYFGKARKKTESVPVVFVDEHCEEVADVVKKIATCAGLSEEIALALQRAAQLHDLGKQESIWQRAAGNLRTDGTLEKSKAVAKPIKVMQGRMLGGFRHELASLRYAEEGLREDTFSSELRDLVFHLLAAHHGYARPCFEKKAYDRNHLMDSERIARESPQRFARLQERFGPWGLAYLESILRAADGIVSATSAEEQPNNA
jgi:CRISPR-associated endonuclease/helicase Cas3